LELQKQSLIISRANWRIDLAEKFTFIWMVFAYLSLYFDTCSIVELGNFCNILLGISQDDLEQYGGDENRFGWRKIAVWRWDSTNLQVISPLVSCFPVKDILPKIRDTLPFLSGIDFDNWIF
jgi:hypothetical protein